MAMKAIDMIGKRFGRALVEKELEPKLDPGGRKRRRFLCMCDCGQRFTAIGEALRSGNVQSCGCLRSEMLSNKRFNDLTGCTFGRWYVESEAYRDYMGCHWNCICICGTRRVVLGSNLTGGISTSCGCYNLERLSETQRIDITNQRFFKLVAKECTGKTSNNNCLWRCECDCGREVTTIAARLLGGQIISCGCVKSKGECQIEDFFNAENIYYTRNVYFKDLKLKNYLFFDFGIMDRFGKQYLIEYQGIQHYEDTGNFGRQQREVTDRMKKEYCRIHDIPLFEIRFDEDVEIKLEQIIAQVNPVLNEYICI